MRDDEDRERIIAIAEEIYSDVPAECPPEIQLADFLENCAEYNLSVFVSYFVCDGLFGHSQPSVLTGDDATLFMKRADFFLQTAIKQRESFS